MDLSPVGDVACTFALGRGHVVHGVHAVQPGGPAPLGTASIDWGQVEIVLGDDAELTAAVLAAQDGNEQAFRTVYRAVHPRLLGYIRTLVGEPDAEDVTSEAWLQIARDLDRFHGDADRFRGWAARIGRNRALDHIRMRGRRPAVGGDDTELAEEPAASDTAGEAMESLATDRTMALIAQLPQDQAEAVVLRVVVGLDAKSAAKTLGKRPGAVRTAAHRGLKRLAELLGGVGDPGGAGERSARDDRGDGDDRGGHGDGPADEMLDVVPAQRDRRHAGPAGAAVGALAQGPCVTHSRARTQRKT